MRHSTGGSLHAWDRFGRVMGVAPQIHDIGASGRGGWAMAVPVGGGETLHRVVDDNAFTGLCFIGVSILVVVSLIGGGRQRRVKQKKF